MTLVEIMVAVAIVAILYAAVAPDFSIWIQNTRIRTAAESIMSGLTLAKTEAVHQNTTTQFVSCVGGGSSWDVIAASSVAAASGIACSTTINPGWVGVQQSRQNESGANRALVDITQSTVGFNGLGRQVSTIDQINGGTTPTPPVAVNINVSALPTATAACNCPAGNCNYPAGVPKAATGKLRCLRITVSNGGLIRMCDPALPANTPQGC